MRTLVSKISLFFILGLIIYLPLCWISKKAGSVYKDGAAIICEAKRNAVREGGLSITTNDLNPVVLISGNSFPLSALNPILFDSLNSNRTNTVNLSLPALPIGPNYFELKEYLKYNQVPDYIILMLTPNTDKKPSMFDEYVIQGMNPLKEIPSYLLNRKSSQFMLNYFNPLQFYKEEFLRFIRSYLFSSEEVKNRVSKNNNEIHQMIKNKGFYSVYNKDKFPSLVVPDDFVEDLTPNKLRDSIQNVFEDPYVEKFFDLALENNIDILMISPAVRNRKYRQYDSIPNKFIQILEEYENVHMANNGWKLKYMENSCFSDEKHLNKKGSDIYTDMIVKEFNDVFGNKKTYAKIETTNKTNQHDQ